MINFNPQSLSLLAAATSGIVSALPKSQLARFGIMRAPVAAPLALSPLAATAVGVLAVALTIPSSRRWLLSKTTALTTTVRSKMLRHRKAEDQPQEAASSNSVSRPAKPQRVKVHAGDAAPVLG